MIHLCIDVYMSFFGFFSHLVYYAVLIRGPPCLFIKSSVYVHQHLLISYCPPPFPFGNHRCFAMHGAVSVWQRSSFVSIVRIHH